MKTISSHIHTNKQTTSNMYIASALRITADINSNAVLQHMKSHGDVGAGRPFKLKTKERLSLMLLVYYRLYITYTLSRFLFDLDQSNVCRDISIMEPLIKLSVPLPKKLYKRTRRRLRIIILRLLCKLQISLLDLGYLGVKNDLPTVKYVLSFRKNRKRSELSNEEKRHNRKHSKLRVVVEHTVSRIKKFEIMGTKFRNKLGRYDHASDIVSFRTLT
ncbi:MAG: hypothetical protein JO297_12575 [Nitrososphaeraceae archaeon]|nr:hypothetical protein [Nitrososphaeraceae archaeon]